MPKPQPGILPEANQSALFLVLKVLQPQGSRGKVVKVAAALPSLARKVGSIDPSAKLVCNIGFGSEFWDLISPEKRPRGLRPFKAIEMEGRRAPNTGGDLLFHIVSKRHDLNFELARKLRIELGDAVEVMEEVHGFRYLDSRDLTGFIDGTENPKGKDRAPAALIGKEDPAFAGGSFVFTQRYVHDLQKWSGVPEREQDKVIGRRKRDSKELPDGIKPPTSHIGRVVIEENGEELQIVRHSFPYGTLAEAGLFFIAYCKTLDIPEKMLSRMMGTSGDGMHDHLMNFTRAVSGATFFAPSLQTMRWIATKN